MVYTKWHVLLSIVVLLVACGNDDLVVETSFDSSVEDIEEILHIVLSLFAAVAQQQIYDHSLSLEFRHSFYFAILFEVVCKTCEQ